MNSKKQIQRIALLCILLLFVSGLQLFAASHSHFGNRALAGNATDRLVIQTPDTGRILDNLNNQLITAISSDDTSAARLLLRKVKRQKATGKNEFESVMLSYNLEGAYYMKLLKFKDAIPCFRRYVNYKDSISAFDARYGRALRNLAIALFKQGEVYDSEKAILKSIEVFKKTEGALLRDLLDSYSMYITTRIELKDYTSAINLFNTANDIALREREKVPAYTFFLLYSNAGNCYLDQGDYSKAKLFFEKAEYEWSTNSLPVDDNFLVLINGLAIVYNYLGDKQKANDYYKRGVNIAFTMSTPMAYHIICNYCLFLGNENQKQKGAELFRNALSRAKTDKSTSVRDYYEVLSKYGDYLRDNLNDLNGSIIALKECMSYVQANNNDVLFRSEAYLKYSKTLTKAGKPEMALSLIQHLLFPHTPDAANLFPFDNPPLDSINTDTPTLRILQAKYNAINTMYRRDKQNSMLEAAASTSELIISLLDRLRINISEEESRLILGNRFREAYINVIRDYNMLYAETSDYHYLDKAFEFAERSKAAVLLASTRELNATQLHIPADVSKLELNLQRDISFYSSKIKEELSSTTRTPDENLINNMKEKLLSSTRRRDSLVLVFEKKFPDYYAIKYNSKMAGFGDIPKLLGPKGNYINYILSDTLLYIYVANKKNHELVTVPVDSSFTSDISHFRSLLQMPMPTDDSYEKLQDYIATGNRLYDKLIGQVKNYLISDQLTISPDKFLSYLPFETLPTGDKPDAIKGYKDINYLTDSYDISYTYSATFISESINRKYRNSTRLVAFAPDYPEAINMKEVFLSRQPSENQLLDLPFARKEAEFVTQLAGGRLYENNNALETVFKNEAGNYDIIHLAMHTLLNDKDPMHSTLIFSQGTDKENDGYLKTFEIYGINLKARMVVLSSCNTGTGMLSNGEGIISLARGFMFSGSQSVVMSMWEIEDKSGTDIVEKFYENLKKGMTKSHALKEARKDFLKGSDQLRSHPYFWSTLVIYGDNRPLYLPVYVKIIALVSLLAVACLVYYLLSKRKVS